MCRLIFHDEKACGLLACPHSHACQHAHSLQVETLPHFWTRLESEKCFQMRSGADTLKDKGGLSGSSASWVFPGLHPRVAFKPGSPAVVRSMHIPPWMPRYLCEGPPRSRSGTCQARWIWQQKPCAVSIKGCWSFLISWWRHFLPGVQAAPGRTLGGLGGLLTRPPKGAEGM